MPPVTSLPSDDRPKSSAFTVLNNDHNDRKDHDDLTLVEFSLPPGKNVNVVKPLQREDDATQRKLNSASKELIIEKMTAPVGPQTILDPKFSRALDFKLRRLKEKEILQANLRRPTRKRPNILTTSNPNISDKENTPDKRMSQSNPRLYTILPENGSITTKVSPSLEKSKSPDPRTKSRKSETNDGDKPRFVTTVKTGQFLLPPPELAKLLGLEALFPPEDRERIVYSYSSKPKALASRTKRCAVQEKDTNLKPEEKRCATNVFSGVRALVAGVVGMRHMAEKKHDVNGSLGTTYSNLMHDKRVVRGSNVTSHSNAAGDAPESQASRAARTRRRAMAAAARLRLRPGTPPPAPGRLHHPIQTDLYLEELFDKGQEVERGVQTDLFVDRPATPIYVPAKTGADISTQIYPGDLFDFDLEVQPILEVLIGKTAEQALAEVAQEEELATLREHQRRFCELRDAERAERERLSAQDVRLHWEKERRVTEARAAQVAAVEARERAAAAVLVRGYVAELLPSVMAGLREQGYLVEHIERGVDQEFMPWLEKEVADELESIITSRDVIGEIVRDVVEARHELYRSRWEWEENRPLVEESITPPSLPSGEGDEGQKVGITKGGLAIHAPHGTIFFRFSRVTNSQITSC